MLDSSRVCDSAFNGEKIGIVAADTEENGSIEVSFKEKRIYRAVDVKIDRIFIHFQRGNGAQDT